MLSLALSFSLFPSLPFSPSLALSLSVPFSCATSTFYTFQDEAGAVMSFLVMPSAFSSDPVPSHMAPWSCNSCSLRRSKPTRIPPPPPPKPSFDQPSQGATLPGLFSQHAPRLHLEGSTGPKWFEEAAPVETRIQSRPYSQGLVCVCVSRKAWRVDKYASSWLTLPGRSA